MRKELLALPDEARVWIYQSNREIDDHTTQIIRDALISFSDKWTSHGTEVPCYTNIFHNRFLVFIADESQHVSGCSIDSSVHFIQNMGKELGLDFFDRLTYLYFEGDEIKSMEHKDFKSALTEGKISRDTLVFNNLVKTKKEFVESWVSPIAKSWHSRFL